MLEIVECIDCRYFFSINTTGHKGRTYTCPKCHSNRHIRMTNNEKINKLEKRIKKIGKIHK